MVDLGLFFWEFSTVNPKASGSVYNPSSSEGGWLSHIYSLEFLSIFAVLTNIRRNIKVVLICISLLARDNGWTLWDIFLVIFIYSFENSLQFDYLFFFLTDAFLFQELCFLVKYSHVSAFSHPGIFNWRSHAHKKLPHCHTGIIWHLLRESNLFKKCHCLFKSSCETLNNFALLSLPYCLFQSSIKFCFYSSFSL